MPLESSREKPVPVRVVSSLIGQWIARLGRVWVEGQVTQVTRRPGARTAFLTLRDPAADISLPVTCPVIVLDRLASPLASGTSIVVHGRPDFYAARGQLSLSATEVCPVGIGELLARLEALKATLAAEGLFAAERKRPLPFLPSMVGLVCGRASAAERDVVENARRRWPAVQFRIREVAVQGLSAVSEVCQALGELDRDPEVEVIVVARGGGSVEDLLPFSNEALLRAVSAARTPVISAIGHETDIPLLDLVADFRASTPTDAAKHVVPDLAEERSTVALARQRLHRAVDARWMREHALIAALRSRPALRSPSTLVEDRQERLRAARDRMRRSVSQRSVQAAEELVHLGARLRALSPQATLDRGYAIVHRPEGDILRDPASVAPGDALRIQVAAGSLQARVAPIESPEEAAPNKGGAAGRRPATRARTARGLQDSSTPRARATSESDDPHAAGGLTSRAGAASEDDDPHAAGGPAPDSSRHRDSNLHAPEVPAPRGRPRRLQTPPDDA